MNEELKTIINHLTNRNIMKIIKLMALVAIFMPLLFSCSGGSSSSGMFGSLPDKYGKFVEEKAKIEKEAENIKSEAEKKELIEKSEKLNKEWKVKIEQSAKELDGKPIEIAECQFSVTSPISLEFRDFHSEARLIPSFKVNGEAKAASDINTDVDYVMNQEPVNIVGYDAEGKQINKNTIGHITVENVDGKIFIKANTPIQFDSIIFNESDLESDKNVKSFKLELLRAK